MNNKILVDVIGILLIALVVVVGYKLSPLLLPRADVTVQPDPACDLNRSACRVALPDGGQLEVEMNPRPIPMVRPFQIEVKLGGLDATRVAVDFAGVDMNMGFNRPELTARGGGRHAGEVTLPVCITGQMDWQATVLIDSGSRRIAVPFRLAALPLQ